MHTERLANCGIELPNGIFNRRRIDSNAFEPRHEWVTPVFQLLGHVGGRQDRILPKGLGHILEPRRLPPHAPHHLRVAGELIAINIVLGAKSREKQFDVSMD